jgi:hypothetical protein
LNACDSASDLYSGTAHNTRKRAVTTEKKASALVALIDKLIAEEPYEAHGVAWARRPLKFYSEALGVSLVTIRKRIAEGSFVKLVKSVEGGGTITLLRTGEAPPCLADDYAKRVMIKLWNAQDDKIDKPTKFRVTQYGGRCLWGMAKDIRENIGDKVGFPADLSAQLTIETFKHALADWPTVASLLRIAAQTVPGYKPRFYKFPCIPHLAHFSEPAVHAYVMHVQAANKAPLALACLAKPMLSGKLLDLTDPWRGHPGSTPEIEKAYDAGWAVAEAKAKAAGGFIS